MQLHLKIIYDDASKLAVDVDQIDGQMQGVQKERGIPVSLLLLAQ